MQVNQADYLNSAFSASLAIGRLIGIGVSLKLKPHHILVLELIGCLISFLLIIIFPKSIPVLWISTIIYGLCLASMYPATIDWTQLHIPTTGKIFTIFAVGGAIGIALISLLIGYSFTSNLTGPFGLIIISIAVIILAIVVFFLAWCFSFRLDHESEIQ